MNKLTALKTNPSCYGNNTILLARAYSGEMIIAKGQRSYIKSSHMSFTLHGTNLKGTLHQSNFLNPSTFPCS